MISVPLKLNVLNRNLVALLSERPSYIALHNICHQITRGCNNPRQYHIVAAALDISKAFDTVNIHKLTITNILNIIIKLK